MVTLPPVSTTWQTTSMIFTSVTTVWPKRSLGFKEGGDFAPACERGVFYSATLARGVLHLGAPSWAKRKQGIAGPEPWISAPSTARTREREKSGRNDRR